MEVSENEITRDFTCGLGHSHPLGIITVFKMRLGVPSIHYQVMQITNIQCRHRGVGAYALMEVLVSVCLLSIFSVSLCAGLSSGFSLARLARENLRASQILVQRTEDYRL